MKNYLEFTEFDDKYYSSEEEDNFSIASSAAKAVAFKNHRKLRLTDRTYRKANAFEKVKKRYQESRRQDRVNKIKGIRAEVKEGQKIKEQEANKRKIVNNKVTRSNAGKIAAGTVAGGAVGAGVGNLAASKYKRELASLSVKSTKSEADLKRIKSLKRKITAATIAGGAIGAGAGFVGTKKFVKK